MDWLTFPLLRHQVACMANGSRGCNSGDEIMMLPLYFARLLRDCRKPKVHGESFHLDKVSMRSRISFLRLKRRQSRRLRKQSESRMCPNWRAYRLHILFRRRGFALSMRFEKQWMSVQGRLPYQLVEGGSRL